MKRRTFLASAAVLPAAPVVSRAYLPFVGTPPQSSTITLVESDTTFVSAAHDPVTRRVYVSYIDRARSNKLHVTELIGDRLVELQSPVLAQIQPASAAPAFSPDSPKDAASAMLVIDSWLWLFVSSRDDGDPTGPFKLKLLRWKP